MISVDILTIQDPQSFSIAHGIVIRAGEHEIASIGEYGGKENIGNAELNGILRGLGELKRRGLTGAAIQSASSWGPMCMMDCDPSTPEARALMCHIRDLIRDTHSTITYAPPNQLAHCKMVAHSALIKVPEQVRKAAPTAANGREFQFLTDLGTVIKMTPADLCKVLTDMGLLTSQNRLPTPKALNDGLAIYRRGKTGLYGLWHADLTYQAIQKHLLSKNRGLAAIRRMLNAP